MPNLVVCCDGTWNTPDEVEGGLPAPTNVVKFYNALSSKDSAGADQKKYYHPGVGTDGTWWDKLVGGGAGVGLDRNVKSAYQWLAATYRPGDRIALLGFSRGAFTARSVGGMISHCGLLDLSAAGLTPNEAWSRVDIAFAAYRRPDDVAAQDAVRALPIYNRPAMNAPSAKTTPIHFIGVWDTVGALGIPSDMALLKLLDSIEDHSFHDTDLSPIVAHARHAVGMDEHRQTFTPTFWTNVEARETVKQLWFSGVHCDVGGGYGVVGLSDCALKWMIDEAQQPEIGLCFTADTVAQIKPDPRGMLHDSVTSVFKVLKTNPRCVADVSDPAKAVRFHGSVLDRFRNPPIQQAVFWPTARLEVGESKTVDVFARERWNAPGLFLAGGESYEFKASGEWCDASIKCGPGGTSKAQFQIGEIAQMAASVLGYAETLFRKATGNVHADFWWTKRVEEIDWFALVGVIADGAGADRNGDPIPHTTFAISAGCTRTIAPGKGGYLYCYANDAWQAYGNNSGSVSLTVKRTA